MARLGDVCIINPKGKSLDDDCDVSFVPMQSVSEDGTVDVTTIRKYGEVKKGFTNFQDGDILFAKITPCMENGKGCIANGLKNGMGFGSTEFHVLRPKSELVTSEWIYYLTSWPEFRKECEKNMTGSAGQKRVPKTFLENYQIDIPSLDEQDRITAQLDKVSDLIAKRQAQLDKLDLLVKARFVEITECASQSVTAEEACSNIVDCPHSTPKYTGEQKKYPAIRTSEIRNGQIDWSTMLYVAHEEYQQRVKRLVPMPGDIVYAREGVYGDCVILPREYEFCLGQRTMLFRPNYKICTSEYLHQALRSDSVKRQADQSNAGSTVPHVNVTDAKKFEFPLPAIEMQKEFSNFMERVWRVKNSIDRSLEKLETLKKALVQEYFG